MSYFEYKEHTLFGRYITFEMIASFLEKYHFNNIILLGHSVNGIPIQLYQIGQGKKKILMWSQMHGNESTTTKALFDLLNYLKHQPEILHHLSIYFIPMLNPDGAKVYTRVNANGIDLNRDALDCTQPESKCLKKAYELSRPDFCFNLHDQRTLFSAGKSKFPATISFLAPSYNEKREINAVRQKSMEVIGFINDALQKEIPNQIGRFDDSFNINCTGDMFTSLQVPTILFEAGHFQNDYNREQTRYYVFKALCLALNYICKQEVTGKFYHSYFSIPENNKCFFDILLYDDLSEIPSDIGILFEEKLQNQTIVLVPYVAEKGNLRDKFGHIEGTLSKGIEKQNLPDAQKIADFLANYVKI